MNWSKRTRSYGLILSITLLIGVYCSYVFLFSPPQAIENAAVDYSGASEALLQKVSNNHSNWKTQVVAISGTISSIEQQGIILDHSIFCQFKNSDDLRTIKTNQRIQVKGQIVGYDDLLGELKIKQCIVL